MHAAPAHCPLHGPYAPPALFAYSCGPTPQLCACGGCTAALGPPPPAGSLITRLEEGGTRALQRFGEPYITIGWYELEQVRVVVHNLQRYPISREAVAWSLVIWVLRVRVARVGFMHCRASCSSV